MHVSGVLRFDDVINDMNFFSKFKITSKGPHSLGNHDSNRISMKARGIHPSYLENFDILVCGSSDPGSTALLSPWGRIEGFHFDSTPEEDHFLFEFKQDMDDKEWEQDKISDENKLIITSKTKERYFEVLNNMANINSNIKVYGTSKNDPTMILEGEEDVDSKDEDEKKSESSEG